ncbi:MAG TPA: SDR family NAD(P)-dependent oxidoreductase [Thermoanaerobaculia bacterium]|nr:SDR family NAD(P)-dependent oxidoreductase [Thermoanaerobaculia bacterium]
MTEESTGTREWNGSEIAITAMAGRFPGADSIETFWENLRNGVESIRFFTDEELLAAGADPSTLKRPGFVKAAPVLGDIESFDAALFGIPPHEAQLMDPQQRLFLECAWEALERAGRNGGGGEELVGVYAGLELNAYLHNLFANPEVIERAGAFQFELANDKDYMATRASYKLNLRGPSLTVQSACSTSLVAVHLASQGLLTGECDVAVAGGVSLQIPQVSGYVAHEGGIRSPDGHCRAFDASAQGTVFGSGVAVVVLRRLADALEDGDPIHAVIKGSAINNDGALKIGYSAPGADGQYRVVRAAHQIAEVDPETITYVEAHGTGTALGDPLEISALTRAFRAATQKRGFCAIGSGKTNVGHLRSAAGVTGLIKTVLSMKHRQLPPILHFRRANPQIDFESSPFFVNERLSEWRPAPGAPLRAGVSSFGVGGTNAHVVVEEAPAGRASGPSRPAQLLVLSANTPTALEKLRKNLSEHLRRSPELPLADVAYTLQVGRRRGQHRGFAVCRSAEDAVEVLATAPPGRFHAARQELQDRPVFFLFPGQGAQYPGMGRALYDTEAAFRRGIDECAELLRPLVGLDLRDALFPRPGREEEAAEALRQTALAQPALFALEHSLACLWMEWGIQPRGMLGHSVGEYAAACLAGVFSWQDALALVAERGRLMQELPPGAMLSVPLAEEELRPRLGLELSVAAVNGPSRLVVSGRAEAVDALAAELSAEAVACRRLQTSHAFHSPMMDPILARFEQRVRQTHRNEPSIPFVSNRTGTWISLAQAVDPAYWAEHLRHAVRFGDGLRTLAAEENGVLLEVGPGQTLASLARQHPGRPAGQVVIPSLPHPKETRAADEFLLGALGELWTAGVSIEWSGLQARERRNRVELPTYPFERRRYWLERRPASASKPRPTGRKELSEWFWVPRWKPSVPPDPPEGVAAAGWLVFADREGLGDALARIAEGRGETVTRVEPGDRFEEVAPGRFRIRPDARDDYEALAERLPGRPDRVVHLWGLDGSGGSEAEPLFLGALRLAQFLGQALPGGTPGAVQLRVVTRGGLAVDGRDAVPHPERAVLLGPVRVLPLEHPEIGCALIDVDLPSGTGDPGALERLAEALLAEALLPPATHAAVGYRGEERWVEGFEEVALAPVPAGRLPLPEGGVVLLTGGLGGVGLALAGELARSRKARLVLTGRSGLPDRDAWDGWLAAHGPDDPSSRRIRAVRSLEEAGAEVLVEAADVTDVEALREVVRRARQRFGAVHGAIHAAGLPGGGVIALKTPEAAREVLAPKVAGARALAQALEGEPLAWLVLCSSTYALTGGIGQVDYCAANAFLDAFARHLEARTGVRTLSLNWGAWQEVGMAVAGRPAQPVRPASAGGSAGLAEALPDAPGLHPLLDRRLDGSAYATSFSPARHWVLSEHSVLGTPAVPGTTYLEMVRAAFARETGEEAAEIRDVQFVGPLFVHPGEVREVRTLLERMENGEGELRFRIESGGQDLARGRVRPLRSAAPAPRDVAALAARCGERELEGVAAGPTGGAMVSWGPRWSSFRRAWVGEEEALVQLELPAEFHGDLDGLALHPALLDVATAFVAGLLPGGNLLPLGYGALRVRKPLTAALYAHLTRVHGGEQGDTVAADVALLAPDGTLLVEIERFSLKRVSDSGRPPAAGASPGSSDWIRPTEGVDAFRRVLARGRFAQVAVSPIDLEAATAAVRRGAGDAREDEPKDERFARPDLATAYEPPRDEREKLLVEVWQSALGLEQIGIHDNFFELGGDSVIGIQVVSRAAASGLAFSPEMLFEHQTVAELAWALGASERDPAALDEVAAAGVPVAARQRELLEAGKEAPCWYTVWALPAITSLAPAGLLQEALERVVARHDALRTRFARGAGGWTQTPGPAEIVQVRETEAEMAAALEGLRASLVPESGALMAAAILKEGEGSPVRALLAAHPAAADAASWRLLSDEVRSACRQLASGGEVDLPSPTAPFHRWLAVRIEKARARNPRPEVVEWLAGLDAAAPVAAGSPEEVVAVRLNGEDTRTLLDEIPDLQRIRTEELILAALARTLGRTNGGRPVLVEIEVDGRDIEELGLDLSRTVGCFTAVAPVLLDLRGSGAPGEELRAAKEQIRGGAAAGLESVWMRDFADRTDLAAPPAAGVRFTWLGDAQTSGGRRGSGPGLTVTAQLDGEGLCFDWKGAGAESLAGDFLEVLRAMIADCRSSSMALYTPSDFPDAELSQEDLDKLFSKGIS